MAAVSIRDLDDAVKERLRVRAAGNGRSMEAEIRVILAAAVADPDEGPDLFEVLISRFDDLGGAELDLPARTELPRAVDFR